MLDLTSFGHTCLPIARLPRKGELVLRSGRHYIVLKVREMPYDKSVYTIDLRWEGARPTTGRIYVKVKVATLATV